MGEEITKPYIILGGTFDPIHKGHVLLAQKLYETFKQPVIFVPTATPNYKAKPQTSPDQRLDMLKLILDNDKRFIIDPSELYDQNYIPTVQSLKSLRERIGYNTPIHFLVGEDSLLSLETWDNWQELFNLTNFIVALRPGYSLNQMPDDLAKEFKKRVVNSLNEFINPYGQIYILNFEPLDVSSTQIRSNIAQGLPIDKLTNPQVAKYISDNKLYLSKTFC